MKVIKINASDLGKCRHGVIKSKLYPDVRLPLVHGQEQIEWFAKGKEFEQSQINRLINQGMDLRKTATSVKDQQLYVISGTFEGAEYEVRSRADGIWFRNDLDCIWECKCVSKTVRKDLEVPNWKKVDWIGWQVSAMMWGRADDYPREQKDYPRRVMMTVGTRTSSEEDREHPEYVGHGGRDPKDFIVTEPAFTLEQIKERCEFIVNGVVNNVIPPCDNKRECAWHILELRKSIKRMGSGYRVTTD